MKPWVCVALTYSISLIGKSSTVSKNNKHGANILETKLEISYRRDLGFCNTNCSCSLVGKIACMDN